MTPPGDRAEKGVRILIVEDEPFIALTLEDMLGELGFTVAGVGCQPHLGTPTEKAPCPAGMAGS